MKNVITSYLRTVTAISISSSKKYCKYEAVKFCFESEHLDSWVAMNIPVPVHVNRPVSGPTFVDLICGKHFFAICLCTCTLHVHVQLCNVCLYMHFMKFVNESNQLNPIVTIRYQCIFQTIGVQCLAYGRIIH